MNIIIGIGHPKQVHIWKNIIKLLEERGHNIKILIWERDIISYLLRVYGLEYEVVGENRKGLLRKGISLLESSSKTIKIAQKFKPDLFIAGTPTLAHVSKLFRKPHLYPIDTEHASHAFWLSLPFSDVVCTPSCFKRKINFKKHITFNGFLELAYLHPTYFKPDPRVLEKFDSDRKEKFVILRLSSWSASHDLHSKGIKGKEIEFVNSLEKYAHVFISSEKKLSEPLEKYRFRFKPEDIHSLLSFASLYIGEGGSMAVESAILGTPSINIESIEMNGKMVNSSVIHGNIDELVNKYNLMYSFSDPDQALQKAVEILKAGDSKEEWKKRKEKLIKDKIDVTKFMVELIEGFA